MIRWAASPYTFLSIWSVTGSEWKTRFETQVEMNQQLHLQALVLAEKVEEAKRNLKDSKNDNVN